MKKVLGLAVLSCLVATTAFAQSDDMSNRSTAGYVAGSAISNALHGDNASNWMKRTDVSVSFQKHWKPQYAIETVQPLTHYDADSKSVVFTQARVSNESDLGTTANIGLGYRIMNDAKTKMYGVNAFYDHAFKEHHARVGGGLEFFQGQNEFRANLYKGVSDEREVDTTRHIFEKVVDGYDVEYAHTFKNAEWARVYVNGYSWDFKHHDDKNGVRVGSELQVTPQISVDVGYNKYSGQSGEPYGKVMYRLAGSDVALFGGKHSHDTMTTVESKMLDKVRRQNNIIVERYTKDSNEETTGTSTTIDWTIRVI